MAVYKIPAKYNGLKEAYESHLVSASPRRAGKLSGLTATTTATITGSTLTMQAVQDYYDQITKNQTTKAFVTGNWTVQQTGTQWIRYGMGIEESDIIHRLDRSINQIQLVLDRKDTVLL